MSEPSGTPAQPLGPNDGKDPFTPRPAPSPGVSGYEEADAAELHEPEADDSRATPLHADEPSEDPTLQSQTGVLPVASPGEDPSAEPQPRKPLPRWLIGAVAMLFAVVTVVAHIGGVVTASAGDAATGTTLAYVAIGASIPGFLLGVLAIVLGRGRGWGIVAILLSIFGNPFLLVQLLGFFGA